MKYTECADSENIAKIIRSFHYNETRKQEVLKYLNKDYIALYRGIPIYIKPDNEFDKIIIPQSFANYITELEEIKTKYQEKQLEEIFK